jgi:FdhD protein
MSKGPTTRFKVEVLDGERVSRREDLVVTEEPLELRLEWPGRPPEPLVVTMRTPGSDFELAAGFCLGEGFATRPHAIVTVAYCTDVKLTREQQFNTVTVSFDGPPDREPPQRYGVTSAACGVCGQQSLDELAGRDYPPVDQVQVPVDVLRRLPDLLREAQPTFGRTGGLHAAGLFTTEGDRVVVREDVGRHNAVDKVVGWTVLNHRSRSGLVLAVSGRIGYEIVQKAVAAGLGMIVAVGAPSSLAVELARHFEVTLAGFVRGDRCVVYSAPERVLQSGH